MAVSTIESEWYQLAVPVMLFAIMISMGLELALADFRRVVEQPRATAVGLAGQMILLPGVGLAFAHWPGFSPEIALGVVIITACPGGAASNIFSYLARANTALSITLTSISSVLCFVTIPLWIDLGATLFDAGAGSAATAIRLPFWRTAAQLLGVTLVPVAVGMGVRGRWPQTSARLRTPLRRAMTVLMVAAVVIIVHGEWPTVEAHLRSSAVASLVLVSGMLVLAYAIARAAGLQGRDAFTISIEVGLQNGALATMIVVSLIRRPELIVFPGAYALLSFFPVAAWSLILRKWVTASA